MILNDTQVVQHNHNSYRNATFSLPENLSSYDTLEVFTSMLAKSERTDIRRVMEATVDVMNGITLRISTFVMQIILQFVVQSSCVGLQPMGVKEDG